jgi:hypothetical protein
MYLFFLCCGLEPSSSSASLRLPSQTQRYQCFVYKCVSKKHLKMSLETRVSDQLVEILDFSDQFTSQFLASLAHKCSSVNEIIEKLVAHTLSM